MKNEEIFERLKKMIEEQLNSEDATVTVRPDSGIIDDLGADSLDVVELIMSIEDEFDVEISDEAVESFTTVEDIVQYIADNQ